MKKHTLLSDTVVFLLIVFLFIIPPFFAASLVLAADAGQSTSSLFKGWDFPWYQILLAVIALLILAFYYGNEHDEADAVKAGKAEKSDSIPDSLWRHLIVFPVVFTFGMLFAVSLLCRFVAEVTGAFESDILVIKPEGILQWLFCIVNFLCAAFYEEVLYRFYFIDKLFDLIRQRARGLKSQNSDDLSSQKSSDLNLQQSGDLNLRQSGDLINQRSCRPRWVMWLCEVLGVLAFAFAHLYMGWISVLNAALAHVFLRLCYKKNGHLWPCVTAHFFYNVISLILL